MKVIANINNGFLMEVSRDERVTVIEESYPHLIKEVQWQTNVRWLQMQCYVGNFQQIC